MADVPIPRDYLRSLGKRGGRATAKAMTKAQRVARAKAGGLAAARARARPVDLVVVVEDDGYWYASPRTPAGTGLVKKPGRVRDGAELVERAKERRLKVQVIG